MEEQTVDEREKFSNGDLGKRHIATDGLTTSSASRRTGCSQHRTEQSEEVYERPMSCNGRDLTE